MNVVSTPWYAHQALYGPLGIGAYTFALFGVFFVVLWWRDREPGLHCIGASTLLMSLFYALDSVQAFGFPTRHLGPLPAALIVEAAIILWAVGLAMYVDPRGWRRKWSLWAIVVPQVVLILLNLAQVPVLRVIGNLLYMASFALMAPVVWRARRAEPGAGHELIALSLLVLPLTTAWILVRPVDLVYLRYVAVPSLLLFDMTLLVVSLHRRRRDFEREAMRRREAEELTAIANAKLVEANTTLEQKVQDRTATLREMVSGLESFNRSVSHDLRGPLGGIAGLSAAVAGAVSAGDTAKALRQLGLIEKQATQSHQLVSALLELARAGDAQLTRCKVATQALVKSIVEDLRSRQLAIGPLIEVHPMPDVEADPALLRAVYTNLISNACKFLGDRPHPKVVVGAVEKDGQSAYFVKDNGPGFDREVASRLFQPFQRFHGERFAGHGIGLSIARRAVERHGGRIWAEGAVDQGACFYFTIDPDVRGARALAGC